MDTKKPKVAFLGVGWIGRMRLQSLVRAGTAEVVAVADINPELREKAAEVAPSAARLASLDELLDLEPDGIVISTPNALHLEQSIRSLERGSSVFCQKPLARTATETAQIVQAARAANRLLGVDLSYRHLAATTAVRQQISAGNLGDVFAAELVFHNAYGPDKPWFYDIQQSGGGCVLDLGVHLVDLALYLLDFPKVENVTSRLFHKGAPIIGRDQVEDFAEARIDLSSGATIRFTCSWNLNAGSDALIGAVLYGTRASASIRNVGGSFMDFAGELYKGRTRETLTAPPDDWGGRAINGWAQRLAASPEYDPAIESMLTVAKVLDCIYDNCEWRQNAAFSSSEALSHPA